MDAIFGKGEISQRRYEIKAERNVAFTMSDGIKIDVDIFRPEGKGRYLVLFCASAAGRSAAATAP